MTPLRIGPRGDIALLILRVIFGAAFVLHGLPKLSNPAWAVGMLPGLPRWLSFVAAIAEVGGGISMILGLLTPLFAFLISCNMVVAIFFVLVPHGAIFVATGKGAPSFELPLIYLAVAFTLLLVGPGLYSADTVLFKSKARTRR